MAERGNATEYCALAQGRELVRAIPGDRSLPKEKEHEPRREAKRDARREGKHEAKHEPRPDTKQFLKHGLVKGFEPKFLTTGVNS